MAKKIGLSPGEQQTQRRRDFEKELKDHWELVNMKEKEILNNVLDTLYNAGCDPTDITYKDHPNKMQTGCFDVMYKDQFVGTLCKTIDGVHFTGNRSPIDVPDKIVAKGEC